MKRLFIFAAMIMAAFTFTACGSGQTETSVTDTMCTTCTDSVKVSDSAVNATDSTVGAVAH
jgi:hypothetical protein